ncbi:transglutaminase domain-containing protein [Tessaracoccus sp. HDW20]|uniref:transglutaminase-like domain-containing protein n=1 Tax=Tessaracoccus coleopterorum TaxID=2714950 RepID=UPI0018D3102A|nr:transglutaminase domain-containing protein [Tessaracoccus coleopterorum]
MPEIVLSRARAIAGEGTTGGAAALALESVLRTEGYFSHGQADEAVSLPGHSERRLITLFEGTEMVGDHEQYAVAMALMARELGIPARVVYGYRVGATQTITGSQVGAWTEVFLDGLGWVMFDPPLPRRRRRRRNRRIVRRSSSSSSTTRHLRRCGPRCHSRTTRFRSTRARHPRKRP